MRIDRGGRVGRRLVAVETNHDLERFLHRQPVDTRIVSDRRDVQFDVALTSQETGRAQPGHLGGKNPPAVVDLGIGLTAGADRAAQDALAILLGLTGPLDFLPLGSARLRRIVGQPARDATPDARGVGPSREPRAWARRRAGSPPVASWSGYPGRRRAARECRSQESGWRTTRRRASPPLATESSACT